MRDRIGGRSDGMIMAYGQATPQAGQFCKRNGIRQIRDDSVGGWSEVLPVIVPGWLPVCTCVSTTRRHYVLQCRRCSNSV